MTGIIPNPSVFLLMASGQIESAVVSTFLVKVCIK